MRDNNKRILLRKNYREKLKQTRLYRAALLKGTLQKQPCFICGEAIVEGHHPDYSQPLDVIWLCNKHHIQLHKEHAKGKTKVQAFATLI